MFYYTEQIILRFWDFDKRIPCLKIAVQYKCCVLYPLCNCPTSQNIGRDANVDVWLDDYLWRYCIIIVDYRFYIKVSKSSIERELENQSLIAGGIMTKKLFIYSSDCILFLSLELSLQVLGDCDESCHQERLCSKPPIRHFFINKTRRYSRKRGDIAIQYKFTSFYYK